MRVNTHDKMGNGTNGTWAEGGGEQTLEVVEDAFSPNELRHKVVLGSLAECGNGASA